MTLTAARHHAECALGYLFYNSGLEMGGLRKEHTRGRAAFSVPPRPIWVCVVMLTLTICARVHLQHQLVISPFPTFSLYKDSSLCSGGGDGQDEEGQQLSPTSSVIGTHRHAIRTPEGWLIRSSNQGLAKLGGFQGQECRERQH